VNRLRTCWPDGVALALGLSLALALPPHILADDAAISLRYADRWASGRGFTYNDHERVPGASNPLYVLLLTVARVCALDLEWTARAIGVFCFALGLVLASQIARSLVSSGGAGVLASALLALDPMFRYNELSGMESCLSVVLGLAAVRSLQVGVQERCGWLIGFAMVNKLDAGLLAMAVALSVRTGTGAWPRGLLVRAAVPLGLWCVLATVYFGSPIPHSLLMKVSGLVPDQPFDRFSVVRLFLGAGRYFLLLAAVAALWMVRETGNDVRLPAWALAWWFSLHALALSLIDFGAPYPWYRVVLFPPAAILGAAYAALIWRDRSPVLAVSALVLAFPLYAAASQTLTDIHAGNPVKPWELIDADRRAAGLDLAHRSLPNEIVESAYGWTAYPIRNAFFDASGINSRRAPGPITYFVRERNRQNWNQHPAVGVERLTVFDAAHGRSADAIWFELYGRPNSAIGATGMRTIWLAECAKSQATELSSTGSFHWVGPDLYASVPLNLAFLVRVESGAWQLQFYPATPKDASSSVRFDVVVNATRMSRTDLAPDSHAPLVRLGSFTGGTTLIELRTTAIGRDVGTRKGEWRMPRVVLLERDADLGRVRMPSLPVGQSVSCVRVAPTMGTELPE
jgi:hypothetical protein